MDRFTRWPEAIPLSSITTEAIAQAFLSGWISRFGVPSTIITDRGRQFESQLWNNLLSMIGCKRSRTTSYHPQTNGMVERFHRHLKSAIKAQPNPNAWMDTLPLILLGIRTSLRQDINSTAAEMVYGTTLRLPGEFIHSSSSTSLSDTSEFLTQLKTHFRKLLQAHTYLDESKVGFKNVLFTDETSVQLETHRQFACRRKGKPP